MTATDQYSMERLINDSIYIGLGMFSRLVKQIGTAE